MFKKGSKEKEEGSFLFPYLDIRVNERGMTREREDRERNHKTVTSGQEEMIALTSVFFFFLSFCGGFFFPSLFLWGVSSDKSERKVTLVSVVVLHFFIISPGP